MRLHILTRRRRARSPTRRWRGDEAALAYIARADAAPSRCLDAYAVYVAAGDREAAAGDRITARITGRAARS